MFTMSAVRCWRGVMLRDALKRIREVSETLDDDDPEKLEMLNIEGDYEALMEWALEKYIEAGAMAAMCAEIAKKYNGRGKMFAGKKDQMRNIVKTIMQSADEVKYKGVSGTVGIGSVAPKPIITDEGALPDEFKKINVSVDKTKVNAAIKGGAVIDGVSMDNGGEKITIRV